MFERTSVRTCSSAGVLERSSLRAFERSSNRVFERSRARRSNVDVRTSTFERQCLNIDVRMAQSSKFLNPLGHYRLWAGFLAVLCCCINKFPDIDFAKFFRSVRTCSDLFGFVRLHSDAFGCVRMCSETFGCVWTTLESSEKILKKRWKDTFFRVFTRFLKGYTQTDVTSSFLLNVDVPRHTPPP